MSDNAYTFILQYDSEKDRLHNSLSVMADILEAQEKSSNLILSVIESNLFAFQQLDFIQKGSILVKISDFLKSLRDEEIRDKGLIYIGREFIITAKDRIY